jgi:hypothetical protein
MDDVLDFTGEQDSVGKPVGSDLRRGLITLPTICYIEVVNACNQPTRQRQDAQAPEITHPTSQQNNPVNIAAGQPVLPRRKNLWLCLCRQAECQWKTPMGQNRMVLVLPQTGRWI